MKLIKGKAIQKEIKKGSTLILATALTPREFLIDKGVFSPLAEDINIGIQGEVSLSLCALMDEYADLKNEHRDTRG